MKVTIEFKGKRIMKEGAEPETITENFGVTNEQLALFYDLADVEITAVHIDLSKKEAQTSDLFVEQGLNTVINRRGIDCGTCGIHFESEEEDEKHIFKYRGERWCGIAILRLIELNDQLAALVNMHRKNAKKDLVK